MKSLLEFLLRLTMALFLTLALAQCSSDEQKELKEPVQSEEGDQADKDDKEADDQESDDYDSDDSDSDAGDSETMESSSEADASADVLGDMQSDSDGDDMAEDPAATTEAPGMPPVEDEGPDPLASAPMENTTPEAAPTAAPAMPTAPSGWRVWYVKDATASTYRDTSGKTPSGDFEKGESLLLKVEGQWAMLQDGRYLKASALSMKPVARIRKAGAWK